MGEPIEPPVPSQCEATKRTCHSCERRNLRHNPRLQRDARLREHDNQTCKNKFRTYNAALFSCYMLLPIFRPDGAFLLLCKIEVFFILPLKEVGFSRSFQKRGRSVVGEHFGKLSTSPVEPPALSQCEATKRTCHSCERRNLRHNTRSPRDARLREHENQTCKNKFRTYSAALFSCDMLLPIFRPDGAFLLLCKIEVFFILPLKEMDFSRSFQKRGRSVVGEHFGKLSTSPVEPPAPSQCEATKRTCHSCERRNLRHNPRLQRDARLREHENQTCKNKFRTYSVALFSCYMLLPIFRPDRAFLLLCKIEVFFILPLKEVGFLRSFQKRGRSVVGEHFGKLSTSPVEPPAPSQCEATKRTCHSCERRNLRHNL